MNRRLGPAVSVMRGRDGSGSAHAWFVQPESRGGNLDALEQARRDATRSLLTCVPYSCIYM